MVSKVVMPKLSLTMKEGTVGRWYKIEGDTVGKNEPIVEIISEKATYDLEAPASGILRKILVAEGLDVPVNETLAVITGPDEEFTEANLQSETYKEAVEAEPRIPASPAAKRLAREHGIDLNFIRGSGPEGRVSEEDVQRFIEEVSKAQPEVKETVTLTGFRKISAERLSASFRTAPHSTIMIEVDASKAALLHQKLQVSYTAILVKVAAKALMEQPTINASFSNNQIKIFQAANIGIAVATENGLVVPVIHYADKKSLQEIDTAIKDLTTKAEQTKLTREELSGGTFTITNLGMYGVDFFTPIINPPEAAILGVGAIRERPFVVNGKVEARPSIILSLSYDHRVVDGAPAAEFLWRIKEKIESTLETEDEATF